MDEEHKREVVKRLNVVALNEDAHTPLLVLHRTLSKAELLESVIVIMQWKPEHGGGCAIDWSKIALKDMVFAEAALRVKVEGNLLAAYNPDADHYAAGDVEQVPIDDDETPPDAS